MSRGKRLVMGMVVVGLLVFGVGLMAGANGQDTCPEGGSWVKVENLSGLTYTVDVPDGFIVTENCFKAATTLVFGTGPTVINTTVTNQNGKLQDISHASFLLEEEPSETTTTTTEAPTTTVPENTTTTVDPGTTTTVSLTSTTEATTSTSVSDEGSTTTVIPPTTDPNAPTPNVPGPPSTADELPFTGIGSVLGLAVTGMALIGMGWRLVKQ